MNPKFTAQGPLFMAEGPLKPVDPKPFNPEWAIRNPREEFALASLLHPFKLSWRISVCRVYDLSLGERLCCDIALKLRRLGCRQASESFVRCQEQPWPDCGGPWPDLIPPHGRFRRQTHPNLFVFGFRV